MDVVFKVIRYRTYFNIFTSLSIKLHTLVIGVRCTQRDELDGSIHNIQVAHLRLSAGV